MKKQLLALLIFSATVGIAGSALAGGACCSPGTGRSAAVADPARMMLASYEKISNALAADDLPKAQEAARGFLSVAELTATKLDCGPDKNCPEGALGCTGHLQALIDAETIEKARKEFKHVSAQAIRMAKSEEGFVIMTCPMAGENGDWVQSDTTVRNPYFGSKMLRCGMVKASSDSADG